MKTAKELGIIVASVLALGCDEGGGKSIQINVNSIDVPAGTEVQLCYYMKAPNTESFDSRAWSESSVSAMSLIASLDGASFVRPTSRRRISYSAPCSTMVVRMDWKLPESIR